jgi:membrane-associated phospholipid phosphatase
MVAALLRTGSKMVTSNGSAPHSVQATSAVAMVWRFVVRTAGNLLRLVVALWQPPRMRLAPWGGAAYAAIAVTVALIIALMFFVDAPVIALALRLPLWLRDAADEITDFGRSGWFLYPLAVILIVLAAAMTLSLPPLAHRLLAFLTARAGFLFVAIGLPSLFATIVKRLIGRARPFVGDHDNPFAYMPFIWRPEYASMPSGHATTAAAAAIAIGAIWPRLRPLMWVYAVVIMLTRVTISVHHPSDVLAGALVGVVGALLVRRWYAARRLVFFADDLHPFPGPSRSRLAALMRAVFVASRAH